MILLTCFRPGCAKYVTGLFCVVAINTKLHLWCILAICKGKDFLANTETLRTSYTMTGSDPFLDTPTFPPRPLCLINSNPLVRLTPLFGSVRVGVRHSNHSDSSCVPIVKAWHRLQTPGSTVVYLSQLANHSIVVEESLERPAVVGYEHRRAVFLVLVPLPRVSRPIRIQKRALCDFRRRRVQPEANTEHEDSSSPSNMGDEHLRSRTLLSFCKDAWEAGSLELANLDTYSRTATSFVRACPPQWGQPYVMATSETPHVQATRA